MACRAKDLSYFCLRRACVPESAVRDEATITKSPRAIINETGSSGPNADGLKNLEASVLIGTTGHVLHFANTERLATKCKLLFAIEDFSTRNPFRIRRMKGYGISKSCFESDCWSAEALGPVTDDAGEIFTAQAFLHCRKSFHASQ